MDFKIPFTNITVSLGGKSATKQTNLLHSINNLYDEADKILSNCTSYISNIHNDGITVSNYSELSEMSKDFIQVFTTSSNVNDKKAFSIYESFVISRDTKASEMEHLNTIRSASKKMSKLAWESLDSSGCIFTHIQKFNISADNTPIEVIYNNSETFNLPLTTQGLKECIEQLANLNYKVSQVSSAHNKGLV